MSQDEKKKNQARFRLRRKFVSSYMRANQTPAEERLWQALRKQAVGGFRFRRQHPICDYVVDFYCPRLRIIIEVDGSVHNHLQEADILRQSELERSGHLVVRFTNEQVLSDLGGVIRTIENMIASLIPGSLPAKREGRGEGPAC